MTSGGRSNPNSMSFPNAFIAESKNSAAPIFSLTIGSARRIYGRRSSIEENICLLAV